MVIVKQIDGRSYRIEDVRHIVLTHLDLDHAGGLPDFPHAKVHVHATEPRRPAPNCALDRGGGVYVGRLVECLFKVGFRAPAVSWKGRR